MLERVTSQKQIILDYLRSTQTHPSAEEIFKAVKKKLPRVSLGTIYRNLDNFVKKDIIQEISGEIKHFDADLTGHHHFICKKCNRIFDLASFEINLSYLKNKSIGSIKECKLFVYGVCKKCNKRINL